MTTAPVPIEQYHETDFVTFHEAREITVRIGKHSPELDHLFTLLDATSSIFITGWTPIARCAGPLKMRRRTREWPPCSLEQGVTTLPHVGRAGDGGWSEEGFFALDRKLAGLTDSKNTRYSAT